MMCSPDVLSSYKTFVLLTHTEHVKVPKQVSIHGQASGMQGEEYTGTSAIQIPPFSVTR